MLKKIINLFERRQRWHALGILVLIVVMAFVDMLGVASILPFIAVVSDPEITQTNVVLRSFFEWLSIYGVETTNEFLLILGLLVFIALVFSMAFKAVVTYFQIQFALLQEFVLGRRLLQFYLNQPYSWFLNKHSADLGKTILSEVGIVIHTGIFPLVTIISQGAVAVALVMMLFVAEPFVALSIGGALFIAYILIFLMMSGPLKRLGDERFQSNQRRFITVNEAFSAIKVVKCGSLEETYVQRFAKPAERFAKSQSAAQIIAALPRYALEAVAVGGLLLVMLHLMADSAGLSEALPLIALYAFAGYRLMPALQNIYVAVTQLRTVGPTLDAVHAHLHAARNTVTQSVSAGPVMLATEIKLNNLSYRYPGSHRYAVKDINLTIPVGSTVAFVGETGSGKSTIVDLILGLLAPQKGCLEIDDTTITASNVKQWQSAIGYVPQEIFLADQSVASNIAFGINEADVDHDAVEFAAKLANLHEFITRDLEHGYQTVVGERGVRLSGGQRQRIGIARALYWKPKVLILDEATSALDGLTEKGVIEAITSAGSDSTIIFIVHRLATVRNCDQVVLLDKGKIAAVGTFGQMQEQNEQFRALSNVS